MFGFRRNKDTSSAAALAAARSLLERGLQEFRAGRLDAAIASFREAIAARPDFAQAHNNLGVALLAQGRVDEAAKSLEEALRCNPGSAETRTALARARGAVASALAKSGQAESAAQQYREAIRLDPANAEAHCNLGLLLEEQGLQPEAEDLLNRAAQLAPRDAGIAANLRIVRSRAVPMWHFSMMNDVERNEAYEAAIRSGVSSGSRVLEIGTGSGLLAMMAARAGARHVTTCEMDEALAAKARQIVTANGYAEEIVVVRKKSTDLRIPEDLPERADVLIAEIISSDLIGEGLLPAYEDAKRRLLKKDAVIVPSAASIRCCLAQARGLERFTRAGHIAGFDLGRFNDFAPIKVHPGEVDAQFDFLSDPLEAFRFDLQGLDHFPPQRRTLSFPVRASGRCAGVLQWIRLSLRDGIDYENAPQEPATVRRAGHWQPVLHTFASPIEVKRGEILNVAFAHNRCNLIFHAESP
jgi:tetratricopeptide (TPR) repeat protein